MKLPYLVLIVSLLLTLGATFVFYKSAQAQDKARFQSEVTSVKNRIEILISTYITMIKASRGFVESTEKLDRENFADFVNSLELVKNYTGVQSIGFTKRIPAIERESFEKEFRTGAYNDFRIFPATEGQEYQAIVYLEPINDRKRKLIGFDLSAEHVRREALERARDTGEVTATGKIIMLLQTEAVNKPGFLIIVPIYKGGKVPESIEERRRLLDGYVYSSFCSNKFLKDVQNSTSVSDIAITIYEAEKTPENIMARTNILTSPKDDGFSSADEINVAGRKWIIEYETLPLFASQSSAGWTQLIFMSGLIFSLLLFGMTYLESNARTKAEKITSELQESEKEKGYLLEREQLERKRAEDANKAKDEFISIVSHELRTPLNSIAGWTKILHPENITPEIKRKALEKIDKSIRIQTNIVEELLDFSQILSGKSNLIYEEIDFSQIFDEVLNKMNETAKEKEITIIRENSLNGQKIFGDDERLRSVIKNLLSNAIKFTPKGGKIFAEMKKEDSYIEMNIKDTGEGIKPEFLPHIFEHFRQADSSSTRQYGGLGLGLAISQNIIKLHKGTIEATSEGEGKGTTLIVKLPINAQRI